MKTWQMIKELTESPDKKFKNEYGAKVIHNGLGISWECGEMIFITPAILDSEWEEIKNPVDFMTAFKAWHDEQKTIRHEREYENEIITATKFNGKNEYANFGAGLILSGKWYIED